MITRIRATVYRLLGDLLVAGGVVLLLWEGPDALLARRLTWQVAVASALVLAGLVIVWRAAAAALLLEQVEDVIVGPPDLTAAGPRRYHGAPLTLKFETCGPCAPSPWPVLPSSPPAEAAATV